MKYVLLYILSFSSLLGSAQQTTEEEESLSIIYEAMTRGSSFHCAVTKGRISVKSSGKTITMETRAIAKKDWQEVEQQLKTVLLEHIGNLEAPSAESQTDRARIATLKVKRGDKIFESAPFDEGNPPKELKPLIDKILALAETVE
ncbi:hypothetical protein FK220_013335 [Flavobacteriaceae bacterium TP-CH-4]|uniref:Uncharacterized protein n=1 Tax=Pelagihabitans pacificus TaxID=2696054 RepID=A0A967EBH5_9FLAO|nr:hypothetical protein [Pelagihabitans pacificus]NHF60331.1 hypothetical protein [Pelagihabitans pacificus]